MRRRAVRVICSMPRPARAAHCALSAAEPHGFTRIPRLTKRTMTCCAVFWFGGSFASGDRIKNGEKMPFLRHLPSRPPFGWSLLLSASLPPPALLTLSPRAAAAHPLSSLCLAWLDAMCACPHMQLLIYRSASALLQRSRKTTREGDSQVLSQQQVVLL